MLMGVLHYSYKQAVHTPVFLGLGAIHQHNKSRIADTQGQWERLRILGTWVIAPHTKHPQNINPEKILPLPWDRPKLDIDDLRNMIQRLKKQGKI
jgi:hypothetical protein